MTIETSFVNPTRTPATEAQYYVEGHKLAKKIRQQVGADVSPLEIIKQFLKTADQYAKSTIRKHRANLLEYAYQEWLTEQLTRGDFDQCLNLLKPENAPQSREGLDDRTSAKKAKLVTARKLKKLRDHLENSNDPTDYFLFQMITELCFFFCRPSELMTMEISGADVIFTNAKATNGRACGGTRTFKNAAKSDARRKYLERFTAELNTRILQAGGWETLSQALSSRLARRCGKLKIKRLSFYTFRHVGIATAKSIFSVEELAALAGHASSRTAGTNYAKRRSGLKMIADKMNYSANEENIELVRKHDNWKRPALPKFIPVNNNIAASTDDDDGISDPDNIYNWDITGFIAEQKADELRILKNAKHFADLMDERLFADLKRFDKKNLKSEKTKSDDLDICNEPRAPQQTVAENLKSADSVDQHKNSTDVYETDDLLSDDQDESHKNDPLEPIEPSAPKM